MLWQEPARQDAEIKDTKVMPNPLELCQKNTRQNTIQPESFVLD
jgi:hypothetical protein